MVDCPTSTIALSAHNAIAALGKPCSVDEIVSFLHTNWEEGIEAEQVKEAVEELVLRGHLWETKLGFDTSLRREDGKRIPIRERKRDTDGWF